MSEELLTLRALHEAIVADLREHYLGRVQTVAAYDPFPGADGQEPRPLVTPALLLELTDIGPGEDDGTERVPLRLSFAAHAILSFATPEVALELRELATDLIAHLRHQRWGFPGAVRPPEALSAQPGEARPEQAGWDSWLVTWEQVVHVGADAWGGDIAPQEIWLGIAPRIGAAHVDDYFRIDAAPEVS